jgi:DMSO reductase anchor subunit
MCPYDVPKFSERLGIVRKCDMCHERLAAGEAPACVQGCPNEAISIEIVDVARDLAPALLPVVEGGVPASTLTRPTTRYRSDRLDAANLRPVEPAEPIPSEAHEPLAIMLVLTQAAIGGLLVEALAHPLSAGLVDGRARWAVLGLALALTGVGMAASVLHLGRPVWAFRAFLGVRTSWMSREILVLGAFAAALFAAFATEAAAVFAAAAAPAPTPALGEPTRDLLRGLAGVADPIFWSALAAGLLGLFCSMKIYAVTGRPLWRLDRTALRFGGTAAILGVAVVSCAGWIATLSAGDGQSLGARPGPWLPLLLAALVLAKLELEKNVLVRGGDARDEAALSRTRTLFERTLAGAVRRRDAAALAFGVAVPLAQAAAAWAEVGTGVVLALSLVVLFGCLLGEQLERSLFFRGEAMRAMPGLQ